MDEKTVIFNHIPKNAGLTLSSILEKQYSKKRIFSTLGWKGGRNEAIDYFKRAKDANPKDIRHYLWLGKSYYAKGENNKAKEILSQAMALDINSNSDQILKNEAKELLGKI